MISMDRGVWNRISTGTSFHSPSLVAALQVPELPAALEIEVTQLSDQSSDTINFHCFVQTSSQN